MKQKNEDRPALSLLLDLAMSKGKRENRNFVYFHDRYGLSRPTLTRIKSGEHLSKRDSIVFYSRCLIDYVKECREEYLLEANTNEVHEIDRVLGRLLDLYFKEFDVKNLFRV